MKLVTNVSHLKNRRAILKILSEFAYFCCEIVFCLRLLLVAGTLWVFKQKQFTQKLSERQFSAQIDHQVGACLSVAR